MKVEAATIRFKTAIIVIMTVIMLCMPISRGFAAYPLLKIGSRGDAVSRVQQKLKEEGYFNFWKITGYYGTITRDAVVAFQRSNGLVPDGIVGPKTDAKLFKATNTANRGTTDRVSGDIYWLARIIHAEAQGESYLGKVAVGNVILNRVNSSSFPNTIYGVIFEYYQGIPQFSPVADGSIYNTPGSESIRAANEAYYGSRSVGDALYFFNPSKAEGRWIVNTRQYVTTIGNHAFYR